MEIGRNKPCPCGSGKKYKMCCLGKRVSISEGYINFDVFPPAIEGFDDAPDLKWYVERSLRRNYFKDDSDPKQVFDEAIGEYQKKMEEVNAKLPRFYGVMLQELRDSLEKGEYGEVVSHADPILEVYPESQEAKILKEKSLISLGHHPLQEGFAGVLHTPRKQQVKVLEGFRNDFRESIEEGRRLVYAKIVDLFHSSKSWEDRYAAVNILKSIVFTASMEIDEDSRELMESFLIEALRDDDGRVRNNAYYCSSGWRGLNVPVEFFFRVYDEAKKEESVPKRNTLCRALLDVVSPIADDVMSSIGAGKEYEEAIDFALEVTGYDPEYYKATSLEKMRMNITDRKIFLKKKRKR